MAIEPVTAKFLAQAAFKVVSDEEARKKVIMIALIPVISIPLILTMFQYLITHPWEFFETILSGSNSTTEVKQFHDTYYIEPQEDSGRDNTFSEEGFEPNETEVGHEEENHN